MSLNIIGVFVLSLIFVVESDPTPSSKPSRTIYIGGSVKNCLGKESGDGSCGPNHRGAFCPIGWCCSKEGRCGITEGHCNQESVCPRFDPQLYVKAKGAIKARYFDGVDAWVGGSSANCNGEEQPGRKCGPNNNNGRCPPGQCCSAQGLCGTSKDYCSIASQCPPELFDTIGGSALNCLGDPSVYDTCGPKNHGTFCRIGSCCSKDGMCGPNPDHCNEVSDCPRFDPAKYIKLGGARPALFYDVVNAYVGGSRTNCNGARKPDGKCGPKHDYGRCKPGECCSVDGSCGTSQNHCSIASLCPPKAEIGYGGSARNCLGKPSVFDTCGPRYHGTFCPVGYCCSKTGRCGTSDKHCNTASVCPPFDPAKYFALGGDHKAIFYDVVKAWVGGSVENCNGEPQPDGRCGPAFRNGGCQPGECCSASGFCGSTSKHCEMTSQCPPKSKTGGIGGSARNCLGKPSLDGSCGPMNRGSFCSDGFCCSKDGRCGTSNLSCNEQSICPPFDPMQYIEMGGERKAKYYDAVNAYVGGSSANCDGEPQPDGKCGPNNNNGRCSTRECCSVFGFCGTSKDYCSIRSQCPPESSNWCGVRDLASLFSKMVL